MRTALNYLIIVLVALALTLIPGGDASLGVVLTLLTLAFFAGIALFGVKLYRENQLTLDSFTSGQRTVLYGAIGLALLTFTATGRLFGFGGIGILLWFSLLAMAAFGLLWAYTQSRTYG